MSVSPLGRVYTTPPEPDSPNVVPTAAPAPDDAGRRPVGVMVDGAARRGFPTPSGRLGFWSSTLAGWGWPEHALPGYIRSHVHPDKLESGQVVLLSTFRLPTQIHTRSANSKWLDELSHTNPVWIHPADAARFAVAHTGDLVRVETEIGYFVVKAWITEGIRPGVVVCSHHMGRWKLDGQPPVASGGMMATVALGHSDGGWNMRTAAAVSAYLPPIQTPGGSGGPTPACTRTSRSRSIPTPSLACTAHQAVGSAPPNPPTATVTSRSTPSRPARFTGAGSSDPPCGRSFPRRHPPAGVADAAAQTVPRIALDT